MSCQSNTAEGVVRGRRREDDRSEEVGDGSFTMEAIQQQLQRLVAAHDTMRNEMAELRRGPPRRREAEATHGVADFEEEYEEEDVVQPRRRAVYGDRVPRAGGGRQRG